MTTAPQSPDATPEDEVEASRMTLGEHLEELRGRLVRSALVAVVVFSILFAMRHRVMSFIQGPHRRAAVMLNEARTEYYDQEVQERAETDDPLDPERYFEPGYPEVKRLREEHRVSESLVFFLADSGLVIRLRVCFWGAMILAGPYILFQMWQFIAAGLYKHERKVVYRYLPASIGLFLGGAAFGFWVMVPYGLYFLGLDDLGQDALEANQIMANSYIGFLRGLVVALGAVFQLPVIMLALSKLDLVPAATFVKFRRHTIVAALIVAAILTPPDPITQFMMAGPIIVLYEVGLWLAVWSERRRPPIGTPSAP